MRDAFFLGAGVSPTDSAFHRAVNPEALEHLDQYRLETDERWLRSKDPPHRSDKSLLAIGRIMVWLDGEKTHEIAIAKSGGPARPRDPKRIDRINAFGRRNADDLLPFQPRIAIDLIPSQLADLVQRLKDALPLFLVEPEPGLLEALVI